MAADNIEKALRAIHAVLGDVRDLLLEIRDQGLPPDDQAVDQADDQDAPSRPRAV
jgi:hypothetical protein